MYVDIYGASNRVGPVYVFSDASLQETLHLLRQLQEMQSELQTPVNTSEDAAMDSHEASVMSTLIIISTKNKLVL